MSPIVRVASPDLIGMGDSGKPALAYRFADHERYLGAVLDAIVPKGKIVLAVHDWGSTLGLDWARRNEHRVAGLVLMEFLAASIASWEEFPLTRRHVSGVP